MVSLKLCVVVTFYEITAMQTSSVEIINRTWKQSRYLRTGSIKSCVHPPRERVFRNFSYAELPKVNLEKCLKFKLVLII